MNDIKTIPQSQLSQMIIEHLPHGGFVARDAAFLTDPGRFAAPLYACSEIEELLHWVKRAMSEMR